jgi:hypothetical protein
VRRALRERGIEEHYVNVDCTSQLCKTCYKKVKALNNEGGRRFMGFDAA